MKKIMFNDKYGLATAVLNGQKTMTRRTVQEKYLRIYEDMSRLGQPCYTLEEWLIRKAAAYKVGDVVAVAQCYEDAILDVGEEKWNKIHKWYNINYLCHEKGLHNKMFVKPDLMPHRIRITDIKVERLQDISDEDCLKEGILKKSDFPKKKSFPYYFAGGKHEWDNSFSTPRKAFAALIDRISGKGTWERNPWVFAYSFELIK